VDKYLQAAIEEYERGIESGQPFYMDASTLMDIEDYYEKCERSFDAERLMRFAERLHPDDDDVLTVKAYRLRAQGKWKEAIDIIHKLEVPINRDARLLMIEFCVSGGYLEEAGNVFDESLPDKLSIDDFDFYLDTAEIYLEFGYPKRTLLYLDEIPKKGYPMQRHVDELRAEAYYQLNDIIKAIAVLNKLVDDSPYDSSAWTALADAQLKAHQFEQCLKSCDFALAVNPDKEEAMVLKFRATIELGRYSEMMDLFDDYGSRLPDNYQLRMYIASAFRDTGRRNDAETAFKDALIHVPRGTDDHRRIVSALADIYRETGRIARSTELLSTLTTTATSLFEIYSEQAEKLFAIDEDEEAARLLEYIIDHTSSPSEDYPLILKTLTIHAPKGSTPILAVLRKLAKQPFEDIEDIYGFIVLTLYMARDSEYFLTALRKGLQKCPQIILTLFEPIFNTKVRKRILEEATICCEMWEEEKHRADAKKGAKKKVVRGKSESAPSAITRKPTPRK